MQLANSFLKEKMNINGKKGRTRTAQEQTNICVIV
jgi:hypothetical protein